MDVKAFFLKDGSVNESKVWEEIGKHIQQIHECEESANFTDKINELVSDIINNITDYLSLKKRAVVLPEFIKVMLNSLSSMGVNSVDLPLQTISSMMELAKKNLPSDKRLRTKQDKKNAIFDAAMIVFSQKGFHNAHVDEIAELAGIAKGTIYRYFKSKDDILKDLVIVKNSLVAEKLRKIFLKEGDILQLIKDAIAYYVDFCESNKELYRILIHTPWVLRDVHYHFYNDVISNLPMIKRRILALNIRGRIKTTNFYTVFYGIFGFVDGVMQKWFNDNCEYSLKEELPVIIEVLFYGFVGDDMKKEKSPADELAQIKSS